MIEALGQSPISSLTTAGRNEFMSIFRKRVSKAFGDDPNMYGRPYVSTRGLLIPKSAIEGVTTPDYSLGYMFQFNPQTIDDVKKTMYEVRQYTGLAYNDYIWNGGGERTITFQLFLDNTPQSKQRSFRPTAFGSKLAKEIKCEGDVGYTYDEKTGKYKFKKRGFGSGFVDELSSQLRTLKESVVPSKGPSHFEYTETGAEMTSRIDKRGILPEVEKIQSFLYPAPLKDESIAPKFASGGIVESNQFRPPHVVIFTLGPIYLEGVIKSAPIKYTLFDQDLTPIRGTIDIEFAVFEFENIEHL